MIIQGFANYNGFLLSPFYRYPLLSKHLEEIMRSGLKTETLLCSTIKVGREPVQGIPIDSIFTQLIYKYAMINYVEGFF